MAAKVKKLTARRDKIKVKHGENLVHQIIDAQVASAEARIEAINEALEVARLALEMLNAYESDEVSNEHAAMAMEMVMLMEQATGMRSRARQPFGNFDPRY